MVAARHLLTDIQQQGIVALLGNMQRGLKDVLLANLLPVTLSSRYVYQLLAVGC